MSTSFDRDTQNAFIQCRLPVWRAVYEGRGQVLSATFKGDTTGVEHDHIVAQRAPVLDQMRRHEHGPAAGAQALQESVHQTEAWRVERGIRFVQQHHRCVFEQRARQGQTFAHSCGETRHDIVCAFSEVDRGECGAQGLARGVAAEKTRGDAQVVERG